MELQKTTNKIEERYPEVWKHLDVRCFAMERSERKPVYDFFKRAFDIAASSAALIVLSWLFAIIAAAIKLDDKGPAMYTQTRVGQNGKFFKMYKFRSMNVGADRQKKQLLSENEMDGPVFKMENDPRVTKVGAFLRRTSLDELPQLINIFKGEMSVVGPRPPIGHEVMQYDERAMRRLTVKPGLTCYWQCGGRSGVNFDDWMELDNKYIDDRSFWLDIKLIFKTIPAVLKNEGAC